MTNSSLVRVALIKEATFNVTPTSPALQIMRITSEAGGETNKTVVSEQIKSNRLTGDQIQVGTSLTRTLNAEFSSTHFDELLVASVLGTKQEILRKSGSTECGAITLTTTFAVNAGGASAKAGHLLRSSGYTTAANNGLFRVASSTATTIVVTGTLSNEVSAATSFLKIVGFRGASGDITATASGLGSTSLDFTTLGLAVGQWVKIGGTTGGAAAESFATAALNTYARITAIAATALTLDNLPSAWTTDSGTSKTITVYLADYVRVGSTVTGNSFSLETTHTDQASPTYFMDSGCMVNKFNLNCPTQSKVTCSFEFLGMSGAEGTAGFSGATYVAAPTTDIIYNSSSNASRISEGGSVLGAPNSVTDFSLSITNNLRELTAVGSVEAVGVGTGQCSVTGNLTTYFGSLAIYTKAKALTTTSANLILENSTKAYVFTLPRIQLDAPRPNAGGLNQDVTVNATINAAEDSTTATNFQIDMFYEV